MQSIKSPTLLHPPPPFLWGKGRTLLPLVLGTVSTLTCIRAKRSESRRSWARATSRSRGPARPRYSSYLGRQSSHSSVDFLSKSEPCCQAALGFRTYNYGCQTSILSLSFAKLLDCPKPSVRDRFLGVFFPPLQFCYGYFVPGSGAGSRIRSCSAAVTKSSFAAKVSTFEQL